MEKPKRGQSDLPSNPVIPLVGNDVVMRLTSAKTSEPPGREFREFLLRQIICSQIGNLILDIKIGTCYLLVVFGDETLRVIGTDKIDGFLRKHPDSDGWFESWLAEARGGKWQSPNDIKDRYKSASILGDNRVIFNVKGNNYRMEIQVSYKNQVVVIKRVGTHAEYDRWES